MLSDYTTSIKSACVAVNTPPWKFFVKKLGNQTTSVVYSIDRRYREFHTEYIVQLSFKKPRLASQPPVTLAELKEGENGILERIDLPHDVAQRLMELGFLPGTQITRALSAPGGDPRVFRVDGSEIALRRETASRLILRVSGSSGTRADVS